MISMTKLFHFLKNILFILTNILIGFYFGMPLKHKKIVLVTTYLERNSLKKRFYNTSKPNRELTTDWFLGFCDGEACFTVSLVNKVVRPQFIIGIHQKDQDLCYKIKNLLECGSVYQRKSGFIIYQISKCEDLLKKLLPLLYINGKYHRLRTKKKLCVSYFARILQKVKKKEDKTDTWLNHIRLLKKRMSDYKKSK
ncbi:hypothetical protein CLOM_g6717 [Closterium sp. NIES-68]|nr:hypothetical protein CLOM_g6717 [Closterium sp. NIES-68]